MGMTAVQSFAIGKKDCFLEMEILATTLMFEIGESAAMRLEE